LEIAGVIVSTAASLFIVFLLGVYAGHGLGDRRVEDDAERVVRLPAPPSAEESPSADDALTFDDTLGDADRAVLAAAPRGGAAAVPVPAQPAARPNLPAPDEAPAVLTDSGGAENPVQAAGEHARPAEGASAGDTRSAAADPGNAGARAPAAARTPDARVAVAIVPSSQGGEWSVQVTATREPRTADDMVKRLRARGYDAYIIRARREGATFYRVRVGHYESMEHAGQMVSRLRREPGVPEAFVASD
jgi:cell division septation protein DedD